MSTYEEMMLEWEREEQELLRREEWERKKAAFEKTFSRVEVTLPNFWTLTRGGRTFVQDVGEQVWSIRKKSKGLPPDLTIKPNDSNAARCGIIGDPVAEQDALGVWWVRYPLVATLLGRGSRLETIDETRYTSPFHAIPTADLEMLRLLAPIEYGESTRIISDRIRWAKEWINPLADSYAAMEYWKLVFPIPRPDSSRP